MDFKKAVQDDLKNGISKKIMESEAKELREPVWEDHLRQGLDVLGKTDSDLLSDRKGADWKVILAGYLRKRCLASNVWLAERLNMGTAKSVSSRISQFRSGGYTQNSQWKLLEKLECVDWVGIPVTGNPPPHRSVREELPHTAPALSRAR